jgi:glucose-6-phosphate 1-dehydrogenase
MDHDEYLKRVKSYIKTPTQDMEKQLEEFCGFCTYVSGQYDKDESFVELRNHLESLEKGRKETNRIFYMALPPSVFITVSQHLKRNCYPKSGVSRVIVSWPPAACLIYATNRLPTGREAIWQGLGQFPRAPARAFA